MNEQIKHDIIQRYYQGQSMRGIARELNLGRDTVRKVVAEHQQARSGPPPAPRGYPGRPAPLPGASASRRQSLLDEYEPAMRELLARYPNITAVRMLEELRQRGFSGRYSIVRDRLRELRPAQAPSPVQRFETAPGQQAQMDYAQYDLDFTHEGRRRVYLFSYVLGYSRRQYLRFTENQDFATTIREHVRAFEHLGGVAAECLYDNMKVVVSRHEDGQPIYNTRFLSFAAHYGFRPVACQVRRPQTKGKVERPFYYVETNLLNAREFRSLAHLNELTRHWLTHTADVRIHRQTGKRPLDLHAEEAPRLLALPANPYDTAEVVYRSVDSEGFVAYRQNQYSAPWRLVGRVLPLRITESEVIVYGPQVNEVGRHPLLPRDCVRQQQILPEHRPPDNRKEQLESLKTSFAEFGEVGQRFLSGLLESCRYGQAQARKVLALRAHYHPRDLQGALERALQYGAFTFAAVERILHVQAQPKSTLETLADQEKQRLDEVLGQASVDARPTEDYQYLLFDEPCNDQEESTRQNESSDAGLQAPSNEGPRDGDHSASHGASPTGS